MKLEINSLLKTGLRQPDLIKQIPLECLEPLQERCILEWQLQTKMGVQPSLESITRALVDKLGPQDRPHLLQTVKEISKTQVLDQPSQTIMLHAARTRAMRKLFQVLAQIEDETSRDWNQTMDRIVELRQTVTETKNLPISARDWTKIERLETDEVNLMIDWFKDNGVSIKKKVLYAFITMTNGGKTILKTWMAFELMRVGQNVLFLAQEEPYQDTIRRIHQQALELSEKEYAEATKDGYDTVGKRFVALSEKNGWGNIWVVEWPGISIDELRVQVKQLEDTEGVQIDGLVIDYAKLVQSESKSNQEWERLGKIFTELKQLAMDTNKWVFTSMQLNRDATKQMLERGRMPNLADVAGAYDATHSCNYVWAARLDYETNRSLTEIKGTFTLSVQKQKYGDLRLGDHKRFQWTHDHSLHEAPEMDVNDVSIPEL